VNRTQATATALILVAIGCQKGTLTPVSEDDTAAWGEPDGESEGSDETGADADAEGGDAGDDKPDSGGDGEDDKPDGGDGEDDKPDGGDGDDDKPDNGGDTGTKPGDGCAEDFDSDEPCEGTWEDTMCTDDEGVLWWCEDGAWNNTDDKP
jgi:hypothetical protein